MRWAAARGGLKRSAQQGLHLLSWRSVDLDACVAGEPLVGGGVVGLFEHELCAVEVLGPAVGDEHSR
jgi:hypothetical protein